MWTLLIITIIAAFIYGIICQYNDEDNPTFLIWIPTIVVILFLWTIWVDGRNGGDYLSKDIRRNHHVQYREVQYGKVDSIAYYINGELIQYNEINKLD